MRSIRDSFLLKRNRKLARILWPTQTSKFALRVLRELTTGLGFSIELGELRIIDGHWYVTNSGLLRMAARRRCRSIDIEPVANFSDPLTRRWVFKCIVQKSRSGRRFVGFGDADPSNVSPLVRGAEMRIAETRAVNRALRKAYGIGLCSVEELGYLSSNAVSTPKNGVPAGANGNGSGHSQSRIRDRLCLLIRQHQLDPTLVKRYAADFCGTDELREASRDLVESFVNTLADQAANNRDGLVCKLNSYARFEVVKS